jgi:Fe2+ transport system protein FeoA
MKTLDQLKRLQTAIIKSIDSRNSKIKDKELALAIENRLLEMGFIENSTVTILHAGFGGYPLAVRINNYNTMLSLRKLEASLIEVEEI